MRDDLVNAAVAQAEVVSNGCGDVGRLPIRTATVATATVTVPVGHLPPQPGGVQATHLEIVQSAHIDRGFSVKAAERMSKAQKGSSLRVYEGKWRLFNGWFQERHLVQY